MARVADEIEGEGLGLGLVLVGLGIALWRADRAAPVQRGRGISAPPVHAAPRAPLSPSPPIQGTSPMTPVAPADSHLAMWQPIVHRLIAAEFPRVNEAYAMKWAQIESDGNPCAVGDPGQIVNGQPAEIGLGQLYNPDDFARYGVHPAAFRAYCPNAAPLAAAYNAAKAAHDHVAMAAAARQIQTMTRALSQAEMDDQVRYTLLKKIDDGIANANSVVRQYGLTWNQPDFWKLVKAPHAWPSILNEGMPAVVKKLDRAPSSWAEFRQELGMDGRVLDTDGNSVPKFPLWVRGLNACEACGDAVTPAVA